MNTFNVTLREKAKGIPDAIVAQRLKRLPTIIDKLSRQPQMALSRMQDVGGLRVIVPTVAHVHKLRKYYKGKTNPHELCDEYDYIMTPKDDGYRGIHLVYKYKSTQSRNPVAKGYDGLRIELQLRTELQHIWATTVEVAGLMRSEKLKSDQGNAEWLAFFKAMSVIMSIVEKAPSKRSTPDSADALTDAICTAKRLNEKLAVIDHLASFSVAIDRAYQLSKSYYCIVAIKIEDKKVTIMGFSQKESEEAVRTYNTLEQSNEYTDQVLVKAGDIKQLKRAYPNYFSDTEKFVDLVRRSLEIAENIIE